jgi:KaiC/GvpD/RAD55 family RecA-like ATPase/uncharacterized protein (DUF3084 family)
MPRKSSPPQPVRSPSGVGDLARRDLEVAGREALLQLRIGRVAHVAAIGLSALLALDALLLLAVSRTLPVLQSSDTAWNALAHSYYLLLPIVGALVVSALGLAAKWEAFQVWPWERHFSISVGAFGLSLLVLVLYALRVAGTGPTAHIALYPGFVPLSLAGASAALVGTAATWQPWGARQWTSAIAAVVPLGGAFVVFAPASSAGSSESLALALLVAAILYQTSGSLLHLVSSGTAPHEQAVVLSSQNRVARLAGELRQREEAIRFREAALLKREAEAESAEAVVERARSALTDRESRLDQLAADRDAERDAAADRERKVAGQEAAFEGQSRVLAARGDELTRKTAELSQRAQELSTREKRIAAQEGDLARRDAEQKQRDTEVERRQRLLADGESRITARRKEIDEKTAELLRREGEVAARERSGPAGPRAGPSSGDLAAREAQAKRLKTLLDEQNVELGRRSKEVSEQAKALEATVRQIGERQAHLVAREAALSQRETDVDERLKTAEERRAQFETALRDYERRVDELGGQQVTLAQRGADLDRQLKATADRSRTLEAREGRLRTTTEELDRREADIVLRERSVDADAAEVSLRRRELSAEGDLPFAGLLAVAAADRAEAPMGGAGSSRGARGRRTLFPADAPIEPEAAESATLATPSARKHADRLPTGTPRLDDLLLGGLPPKSHVALVGDAFVGKEVALYAFLAEGLRRGEPVLIVTAARTAAEIAASLGVLLPQFHEYEQLGTVTWIDASGTPPAPGPHVLVAKSSDDRAGILTSLVEGAKRTEESAKGGSFRVGFFGLSSVLAHGDERSGFSFLQNVVAILKTKSALAMYGLEAGALTEAQVESLLGRMDGAILFRQDRDRTFLSVKGFGEVATREWVEVRATSRSLVVGSFALERIR